MGQIYQRSRHRHRSRKMPVCVPMRSRPDLVACLGLVAVAAAWTGGALVGAASLTPEAEIDVDPLYRTGAPPPRTAWGDPTPILLDWPRDRNFADGLHAGRLDLWNPWVGCGAPLWFEQGGPVFPLKRPFYRAPDRVGHAWYLFLRCVAAAIGADVLARARGLSPVLAFAAGMMFELSGSILAQTAFGAASGMALMPWAILGAHLLARGRGPLVPALTLGVVAHSGHPMVIFLVYLGFGAALLGHMVAARRDARRIVRLAGLGAASAALGLALAAPVLLPFLELQAQAVSYRDVARAGRNAYEISIWRDRIMVPVSLYAPGVVGLVRHEARWLFPFPFGPALGLCGFMLALTGVMLGALDAGLAALLVAGACLAVAPPPLDRIIPHLPGVRHLNAWYCWTFVTLPLTQAAARAMGELATGRARRRMLLAVATTPVGLALAVYLPDDTVTRVPLGRMVRRALERPVGLAWAFVPPAAFLVAAATAFYHRRLQPRAGAILGVLALVELAAIMARYQHEPRSRVLADPMPAPVRFLRAAIDGDRFHAFGIRTGWPNTAMLWGIRDLREISPLPLRRYVDYLAATQPPAAFFPEHTAVAGASPLFDQASVAAFAVDRNASEARVFGGQKPIYEDPRVSIYANANARRRARIAPIAVAVPSEEAARARLRTLDRDTVAIEPADGEPAESL